VTSLNDGAIQKGELFAERYRIVSTLGKGGMGTVYLAEDTLLNNSQIALKVLHPQLNQDQKQLQRFYREVQFARKVTHPNIVRTFDVGQARDSVFFTMEHVEGYSLKECLLDGKALGLEQSIAILLDITNGLSAVHQAGIIHRDLKPANIMLCTDGLARISDFGVARTEMSELTNHDEVIGSAAYLSPEAWTGQNVTHLTDIYALGVMAFEMLTGGLPFNADSPASLMFKHLKEEPPAIEYFNKEVPKWLNNLVLSMLAKDQNKRPQNAEQVIAIIEQHLNSEDEVSIDLESLKLHSDNLFKIKVDPLLESVPSTISNGVHTKQESEYSAFNFYSVLTTLKSITLALIATAILIPITAWALPIVLSSFNFTKSVTLLLVAGFVVTEILAINFGIVLGLFFYSSFGVKKYFSNFLKPLIISLYLGASIYILSFCLKAFILLHSINTKAYTTILTNIEDTLYFASQKMLEAVLLMPTGVIFGIDVTENGVQYEPNLPADWLGLLVHGAFYFLSVTFITGELAKCTANKKLTKKLLSYAVIGLCLVDIILYIALPSLHDVKAYWSIDLKIVTLFATSLTLILAPLKWAFLYTIWCKGFTGTK
jgi:serine/threonine protein kinase